MMNMGIRLLNHRLKRFLELPWSIESPHFLDFLGKELAEFSQNQLSGIQSFE